MILPNDILIRKTSDGQIVWVSQRLVCEVCGVSNGVMEVCRVRYKQSLPPSWREVVEQGDFFLGSVSGKSWRWGRKNGQFYYDADTIPNRKPCCYRDKLPSNDDLIALVDENRTRESRERRAEICKLIVSAVDEQFREEDVRWIRSQSGYQLNTVTCRDYAKALAWSRFINGLKQTGTFNEYGINSLEQLYDTCAGIIAELRLSNFKVNTGQSLRIKLTDFPVDIIDQRTWIISGKHGNSNRLIVGKYPVIDYETGEITNLDIHQAIMYRAYMNIDGPEKEKLQTLYDNSYCPMLSDFGQSPVAYRTFCNHLTRFSVRLKADLQRHGLDYYKKKLLTYTPTEKLSYAHSLFCGDGSGTIGYRYWKKYREDGVVKEKLSVMNLYVMVISDVASGYIAGYGFAPEGSHKETYEMLVDAVRMSVHSGGDQTMFEFISDNHTAFSSEQSREYLHAAFNRVRRIEVGNSQANPAETQFRLFKNSTLRSLRNFIRTSHNASVDNRANMDNVSIEDFPTYTEVIDQFAQRVEIWNHKRRGNGMTPAEMFENKHPACQPIDPVSLRLINGDRTFRLIADMRGFVAPEGKNATLKYEIPDYENTGIETIQRATGYGYDSRVYVVYDHTGADLYSSDGKFILTCPPASMASMSYIEKTDDHRAAQMHHSWRKKNQLYEAQEFADKVEYVNEILDNSLGYDADIKFGGSKETVNEMYEHQLSLTLEDKINAERAVKRIQRAQKRRDDKALKEESQIIMDNHIELIRKKTDLTKYIQK